MKLLFLLIGVLYPSTSFSAESPPSPHDGRDAAQEAFKQRLAKQKAEQEQRIQNLIADRAEQRIEARRQEDFEEGVHPLCHDRPNVEIQPLPKWLEDATKKVLDRLKENQVCNCNCGKPTSCTIHIGNLKSK